MALVSTPFYEHWNELRRSFQRNVKNAKPRTNHDRVNSRTGLWNKQLSLEIQDGWSPYMYFNEFWITGYVNGLCSCCCCFRDISSQWCWWCRRQPCHRRRTQFYAYTEHYTLKQCWGEIPLIFHYTMVTNDTKYCRMCLRSKYRIILDNCGRLHPKL